MQVAFTNPEAVPEDLPPGKYMTRVIEANWVDGEFVVQLEFLGEFDENDPVHKE